MKPETLVMINVNMNFRVLYFMFIRRNAILKSDVVGQKKLIY